MSSQNCCGACPFRAPMREADERRRDVIQTRDVELRWRASPLTLAVATCAGVALAAALIAGRWQLIAFAAPLLGVLCSIYWQRPVPTVHVHAEPDLQRCFEDERVGVKVWATVDSAAGEGSEAVLVTVRAPAGMQLDIDASSSRQVKSVEVVTQRWGRYPIEARVDVVARGGLLIGDGTVEAAQVVVFPLTPPQPTAIPQTELLDRLGAHLTRYIGPGVEYADIRPYVPGGPAAGGELGGQRAARTFACDAAVDRPSRRRHRADRHLPAAAGPGQRSHRASSARGGSGGSDRPAQW